MDRSTWVTDPTPRKMGSGALVARLEQSLAVLESLGIQVPETGRHRSALKVLQRWHDAESLEDAELDDLLEIEAAHRTTWETYVIAVAAEKARHRAGTPFTLDKLTTIMGGSDLNEGRDVEPRNTQFELYIAALLHLAGLSVEAGEPDLLFDSGKGKVGVAAKRLRSPRDDQLTRHVKKARDQIVRSGHPGWIALNFDQRFEDVDPLQVEGDLLASFEAVFDQANDALGRVEQNQSVLGFMIFGYCGGWMREDGKAPSLHSAYPFRWVRWADSELDADEFAYFMELWRSRIDARLQRLASPEFEGRL